MEILCENLNGFCIILYSSDVTNKNMQDLPVYVIAPVDPMIYTHT